jgi:hypothetical protein
MGERHGINEEEQSLQSLVVVGCFLINGIVCEKSKALFWYICYIMSSAQKEKLRIHNDGEKTTENGFLRRTWWAAL